MTDLISPEYRAQLQAHAAANPAWGSESSAFLNWPDVHKAIREANTMLDYGCGAGDLVRGAREIRSTDERENRGVHGYDPRNEADWPLPDPRLVFDLVTCTDVLEHVEREKVPAVLAYLRGRLAPGGRLFLLVSTVTAKQILPATDALPVRNAHITVEPFEWWLKQLQSAGFTTTFGAVELRWSHFYGWFRGKA